MKVHSFKTKTFCETPSIFEIDKVKNQAILRDFLQKWTLSAKLTASLRFAFFPLHVSKVLRLARKSEAKSYEVPHLSLKIILANLKIRCSKMQPPSGNQHPDLLTCLTHVSLVLRLPGKMHLCRSSSDVPRLPSVLKLPQNPHVWSISDKVQNPLRAPHKTKFERPKWSKVYYLCWLANVLRATAACTFEQLNFQKCSENGVFCTFRVANVLCATAACTFSTSQLPKAVRDRGVLSILTLKSASRHSVQFTILHLTILCRRTRRFSKPTFRASRATKHLKSTVFRDFPILSRAFLFFLLTRSLLCSSFFFLSLLWLFPPLLLHLSFLSKVWLLNFLR